MPLVIDSNSGRSVPGVWSMQEVELQGTSFVPIAGGEHFQWVASGASPDPTKGGVRAAPAQPWTFGITMVSSRTKYPGARSPSEQLLGPDEKPQTIRGRWDDRYNFPGYALKEVRRIKDTIRRGNLIRIQFQNQVYVGIMKDVDVEYYHDAFMRYVLQFSIHDQPEHFTKKDAVPSTTKSAAEAFDDTDAIISKFENETDQPLSHIAGTLNDTVGARLSSLTDRHNELGDAIDNQEIRTSGQTQSPFKRLGTKFRTVETEAHGIITDTLSVNHSTGLGSYTAMNVLEFEVWMRTLRHRARIVMSLAQLGGNDMDERDSPNAERLYPASKGQSMYAISREVYGTPWAWGLIYERNNLSTFILTGDEILIIPEREAQ